MTYRSHHMHDDASTEVDPCHVCNGAGGWYATNDPDLWLGCRDCDEEGGRVPCVACGGTACFAPAGVAVVVETPLCVECVNGVTL